MYWNKCRRGSRSIVHCQQHCFLAGCTDMRNGPYPIDALRHGVCCGCPISVDLCFWNCYSTSSVWNTLWIFPLKEKKKVMYEVKQGRRNHLLLQKSVKLLLNHFCYSPHLALTDWTFMSVTAFFAFPFLRLNTSFISSIIPLIQKQMVVVSTILKLHEFTV